MGTNPRLRPLQNPILDPSNLEASKPPKTQGIKTQGFYGSDTKTQGIKTQGSAAGGVQNGGGRDEPHIPRDELGRPRSWWEWRWSQVESRDLGNSQHIEQLYRLAVAQALFRDSEINRQRVFAEAARASRPNYRGARGVRIFGENVPLRRWWAGIVDHDRAVEMIAELDRQESRPVPAPPPQSVDDPLPLFRRLTAEWGQMVQGKSVAEIISEFNIGGELRAAMQRYPTWSGIEQRNTLLCIRVLESIARRVQNGQRISVSQPH